jgi:hypothetical protein
MFFKIIADFVLILHLCFIFFVIFGGFLILRWNRVWRLHLPAVVWGLLIQYFQWNCPLTDLENYLRINAGEAGYQSGFIEYFVTALIYPQITSEMHIWAGIILFLFNLGIYYFIWQKELKN